MKILKFFDADENLINKIEFLFEKCCSSDGIGHPFYFADEPSLREDFPAVYVLTDNDNAILSALTVYFISPQECHAYGLTHPDFRNKGFFSQLLQDFINDATGHEINNIIIPVSPKNEHGKLFVKKIPNVNFDHTEYILKYDSEYKNIYTSAMPDICVSPEKYDSQITFCCHLPDVSGEQIGMCKINLLCECATIYDFKIRESYRYKGYGSAFLHKILNYLLGHGNKNIILQVSGANTPAYTMYMHHGFKIYSELDLFTLYFPSLKKANICTEL